ncbi:S phase cyclin A-associated protein in the endoplasmic reticulum-like isoform X1 [Phoenix dactylifera]|uniref:S phase cyclin A-associated protein in the endoplasmic reticulum-like isoform X1 n=1 Tax=Phoenix dactylifera TaxID=42345 RepID=A0A8B7MUI4_PHODC|nr:S phase cyclin A-associated protein in the endoplasmic reticulum-like isoform X1 [Phoenix dactylifera]XP_017698861.2 S phase cyclin A-associated protein in the endoplasmic reticulum-like isoform X1 [Phoenix dactylifera]
MENNGETGDDPGSGWLEVKKYLFIYLVQKHRTSSKLAIQKALGKSSNIAHSFSPHSQTYNNDEARNLQNRRPVQPIEVGFDCTSHSKNSSASSLLVEVDQGKECPDKSVVERVSKSPKVNVANSDGGTKAVEGVSRKENMSTVPKIRWGDLEDIASIQDEYFEDSNNSAKDKHGEVVDGGSQEHGHAVKPDESVLHASPYTSLLEDKAMVTSKDVEQLPDGMVSSNVHEESGKNTLKNVNEIPSEDVEVVNAHPYGALGNLKENHDGGAKKMESEALVDLGPNNANVENSPSSPVQGIVRHVLQVPHGNSENRILNSSEISVGNVNMGIMVGLGDSILLPHQNSGVKISVNASVTTSLEDQRRLQDGATDGAEFGEGEPGESKERFRQRLWCFLFENLNRAVDELYLLCELECDMEQMNEAILVLEEATSDFRELKCRVEHFENTKRSSSHLPKDGTPMTLKTDHRRPHALSWEVRRMTTSPHRAEILSSSLEAFKKIQLERAGKYIAKDAKDMIFSNSTHQVPSSSQETNNVSSNAREAGINSKKQTDVLDADPGDTNREKQKMEPTRRSKVHSVQIGRVSSQSSSASALGKCKREPLEPITETEKQLPKRDKEFAESRIEKNMKATDMVKKHLSLAQKEKQNTAPWKSMDAWKEKRNWNDILKSPMRTSSRVSYSPGMSRKGMERARMLHDKLMSPEKKKKSAFDMKREAEEKHARALRIRNQLENERVQRLQRTSEKLNRVNEWQAVRNLKLREVMHARLQRSGSRHEAYLAQVVKRAGDESSKVNEVRFITSLNEENKKLMLRQKLQDSEMRRAEKLQVMRTKQREDTAREEAVLERRKLLEAEKLQRLAETQRKKEEAQVRREEERRASSAAREAKAVEQLRRKEIRAKAQQEEAELLAQRLAERLSESEQRRKYYLEQIRERASMDFRDQSSPLQRRTLNKEGQTRSVSTNSGEDCQTSRISGAGDSAVRLVNVTQQHSLKRRIKKIRQRLMALKHEYTEPPVVAENIGIGYRVSVGAARAKIGKWLQDLQRLRQARKEGAASIGLIVGDIIKFLEGKDLELHASRQAGLLDFVSSALPASHTSKPEACQVTVYLLRLLRVVLSLQANRSYFLAQNLLPPTIPMLSGSLENYIKVAASSNNGNTNLLSSKTSTDNLESVTEVLDGFLWTVTAIIGHAHFDDRQLQMQDSLMELIVAYQVIHRLRDLFALYDRPQVEGSPFPSSILLSLNLLAVLTSRPGTFSSIDWESCTFRTSTGGKIQELEISESPNIGEPSLTINSSGDSRSPLNLHDFAELPSNKSGQMSGEKFLSSEASLSDILVGRPLDEENRERLCGFSLGQDNVDSTSQGHPQTLSVETQNVVLDEHAKSLIPQKDEKDSMNDCSEKKRTDELAVYNNPGSRNTVSLKQPIALLLSAIAETGLVSLPSLLTAVLLQANNRLSSEQASYILPSNFEEVATGVLKVLNNLALLDITLLQSMLARSDLRMEFFHLMSFLLTHCTNKWKAANDQVGLLLLESLLLLGYFALFHPGNQAVLRWGNSPTILHKVCDLPFVFFSDPELTPILAGTLVAACYGCDQNRGVVQQELSTEMLLSLLKSCRQGLLSVQSDSLPQDGNAASDPSEGNQTVAEARKPQSEIPVRSNRRSARALLGKGSVSASSIRVSKTKIQKTKTCDEWALKHNLPASEASSTFMLHRRFSSSFLDKAEQFFSAETSSPPV